MKLSVSTVALLVVILAGVVTGLQGCAGNFTYEIDGRIIPSRPALPGLRGGSLRPLGVVVSPEGGAEEFVANEVILHPEGPGELEDFMVKYGGTILRDGTARLAEGVEPAVGVPESSGWYLIQVNTDMSSLADFAPNMETAGLLGDWSFSTEAAARLMALVARETGLEVSPNFVTEFDQHVVNEHPDNTVGNLDAGTWWWMNEDDNATLPGNQGLSVGVVHAWEYVKYHGYPVFGVPYTPVKLAVIDGGFDLDETTGDPLNGNTDYKGRPLQLDEVDWDWTAGGANPNNCSGGSSCPWHGQMVFGSCCALSGNGYGTAGTSGGWEIRTLLIKVDGDWSTISQGVYDAVYNNAKVINMSLGGDCGWACRNFGGGNELKAYVKSARNNGASVIASAGNGGNDISNSDRYPCELSGVVCVGAILSGGQADPQSDFGSVVDIWAPSCYRSTVTRDSAASDANATGEDELAIFCGTSASAPFVAGIVALMKMLKGSLTSEEVRNILLSTSNGSIDPKVNGYVDAYRAVAQVKANQPPTVTITSPTVNEQTPYANISFWADVNDPESPNIHAWGPADFSSTIVFSSDKDGQLCTDKGDATDGGTHLGCTVAGLSLGIHVITATVTDPFGATGTAATTIAVVNTTPSAKITFPATGATYFTSQQINLRGYGFDPDEVIPNSSLEWRTLRSDQVGWVSRGTGPDVWVTLGEGTYTVKLVARDSLGASGTDVITMNVQAGAGYPTVQITQPANVALFVPGTEIIFAGTVSDPEDGSLTGSSLRWSSNIDGFLGTGTTAKKVLSGASCNSIVHTITLEATDSDGHKSTHSITVNIVEIC